MCTRPNSIPNPNLGLKPLPGTAAWYKDRTSLRINIPCGHCEECIAVKQMGYIQRIMLESMKYEIFMIMYSYKEDMIPYIDVNGYKMRYADINDFILMKKRMDKWRKERNTQHSWIPYEWRYFGVTERGGKRGRPHFHIFVMISKEDLPTRAACLGAEETLKKIFLKNWQRNVGSTRKPIYKDLCEYHERWNRKKGILERNYDLHWVDPGATIMGISDAAWYIMKYALKDHGREEKRRSALKLNLEENEYLKIWEKVRNKTFYSQFFGLNGHKTQDDELDLDEWRKVTIDEDIHKYLRKCIEFSKGAYEYPVFINPNSGKTFPMCKYLKDYALELNDLKYFYNPEKDGYSKYGNDYKGTARKNAENKGKRVKQLHELETLDEFLEELNNRELCQ